MSRRTSRMVAVMMAALLVAGGVAALAWPHADSLRYLRGNAVAAEPGETPTPEELAGMDAVDDLDDSFRVASVDLDVPLGALTPVGDTITPPGFTSAYLVRNLGVLPQNAPEGTVFVVMHSLRDGAVGPGNHLIDVDAKTSRLRAGNIITVAGLDYAVTGSSVVRKSELARDADTWADDPGRLVVITCLQRPEGGPSVDNVVIFARLTHL